MGVPVTPALSLHQTSFTPAPVFLAPPHHPPHHPFHLPARPALLQIGTYTLFQETYHRPSFKYMHIAGPKSGGWAPGRDGWVGCRRVGWVGWGAGALGQHVVPPASGLPACLHLLPRALACLNNAPTHPNPHPPADYDNRILTHDRAMRAGLDDVGLGTLFGLYDWK